MSDNPELVVDPIEEEVAPEAIMAVVEEIRTSGQPRPMTDEERAQIDREFGLCRD